MALVESTTVRHKSIAPATVCDYIRTHPTAVLLDVRTPAEFEDRADSSFGTLRGAINIPAQELEQQVERIAHLWDREILVYCSHSHRSPQAGYILTQHRFAHVTNLDGGMSVVRDKSCVE